MLKLTTIFFLIALSVLAALHWVATWLFLYWKFSWFDMPMHFFGGMVIALGLFTLNDFRIFIPDRLLRLGSVALLSLVIILGWEVFKLYIGKEIDNNFVTDTISDVILGSIGSMIGFYIAKQLRTL